MRLLISLLLPVVFLGGAVVRADPAEPAPAPADTDQLIPAEIFAEEAGSAAQSTSLTMFFLPMLLVPAAPPPAAQPTPTRPPSAPTPTPTRTPGAGTAAAFADEVIRITNAERASAGCPALAASPLLTQAAQGHSEDMARNGFMSHTGSSGSSPWDRMRAAGYTFRTAAENVAAGQSTPSRVMSAWMNSAGHRANILNCALREIGIGYATASGGTPYWTMKLATPR